MQCKCNINFTLRNKTAMDIIISLLAKSDRKVFFFSFSCNNYAMKSTVFACLLMIAGAYALTPLEVSE